MMALADLMDRHREDLARLLTVEMGKSLAEARGELTIGAGYVRWFAEEGKRTYRDIIPSPWARRQLLAMKEPVGVVGAISPWNFPNSMFARKLGPALAAGCPIVIKPAIQTPYSALAFGVLVEETGFPSGVVNILTGAAVEIAAERCENPKLRKITFTGSTEVGKRFASRAMAHMKTVSMELGGNAPFIVFDDADLDAAVMGAVASKFRNSGQTCVCANRILVQSDIYDAFVDKFAAAIAEGPKRTGGRRHPGPAHRPAGRREGGGAYRGRDQEGGEGRPWRWSARARRQLLRAHPADRRHP
jgi:succinate-semialdehyde dehydrogenase/glutarate-semialdehyde dehydrogenase